MALPLEVVLILINLYMALYFLISEEDDIAVLSIMSALIRERITKVVYFTDFTVPNMFPKAFRRYFRMQPATMRKLIAFIAASPRMHGRETRISIPIWKKVYMTVAFLANSYSTYKLSELFGVSEEALLRATTDVMLTLIDDIEIFIQWPRKEHYDHIARQFDNVGRSFPNVLGALDGCHLEVEVGKTDRPFYLNHKDYHSINLMAICTYNLAFLDIFVGWPGQVHDSRVFCNSPVYQHLRRLLHVPNLPMEDTFHILADKAFTLVPEVMTPYKGNPTNLSPAQRKYNRHMNSKCQSIERAFSLLKRCFRRLHLLNQKSHEKAVTVVMAACILHNICIKEMDNVDYYLEVRGHGQKVDDPNHTGVELVTDYAKREGQRKCNLLRELVHRTF